MSSAPNSCASHEHEACDSHSKEVVSCQECYLGETLPQVEGEGECVGREQWRHSRRDDGEQT